MGNVVCTFRGRLYAGVFARTAGTQRQCVIRAQRNKVSRERKEVGILETIWRSVRLQGETSSAPWLGRVACRDDADVSGPLEGHTVPNIASALDYEGRVQVWRSPNSLVGTADADVTISLFSVPTTHSDYDLYVSRTFNSLFLSQIFHINMMFVVAKTVNIFPAVLLKHKLPAVFRLGTA